MDSLFVGEKQKKPDTAAGLGLPTLCKDDT